MWRDDSHTVSDYHVEGWIATQCLITMWRDDSHTVSDYHVEG